MFRVSILTTLFILTSLPAFAQFYEPGLMEWDKFLSTMRGIDGASAFAVAIIIVQGLFLALRTSLGDLIGPKKFLILSILSVIVTVGDKLLNGQPLVTSLTDATTLMAYQVLAHQAVKQYKEARNGKTDPDTYNNSSPNELCSEEDHARPVPFRD